jgi:hypothetical protein
MRQRFLSIAGEVHLDFETHLFQRDAHQFQIVLVVINYQDAAPG